VRKAIRKHLMHRCWWTEFTGRKLSIPYGWL